MADFSKAIKGALKAVEASEQALPKVDRLSMSYKDVTKRVPEVADAVERLFRGEITKQQYNDIVNTYKPVTPYSFVPKPATSEEAIDALRGDTAKGRYGKQAEYEPGSKVGLRLDIPAYTGKGVWVNSIHDEKAKKVAYGPVASVKNADLGISQSESKRIALGGSKAPYAKIKGEWNPMSEEEAVAKAQQYLNDPQWRQIGMDPERHSYFYDRHTMEPITGAEEVIQIGPLVLGKNPRYGKIDDFEYADGGKIIKGIGALAKASRAVERPVNRTFKTTDGYTFREMPNGTVTDGDMTWNNAADFMRDMPHAWVEGDQLGQRRAMMESFGEPSGEAFMRNWLQFRANPDPDELYQSALNKQRQPKPNLTLVPPPKRRGGPIHMQAGGALNLLKAAERALAGKKAADVAKAIDPMRMSEALGNLNLEGKGTLRVTQSDRTRVGGGNIGGAMFPGLQQVDPLYEGAVWGVGDKGTASRLIRQSDPNTVWSTVLGSADQLKSNPLVFNKLRKGFTDAMKEGKLSDELATKINQNLALKFGEGADIRDPKIWQQADTFEKRALLADVMLGQGMPPAKGGVALGGEKSGKGVIFQPSEILKRETEPMLLHPEHGGDVPTFAVGPRLFKLSGEAKERPDLHPGFPMILQGEDTGMVFRPAPGEIAMPEFAGKVRQRGRQPGYYDWAMGLKGEGLPSQLITEEYLTHLQKAGHAEGGKVESFSARLKAGLEQHMAVGGGVTNMSDTRPDVTDGGQTISAPFYAKGGEIKLNFKGLRGRKPKRFDSGGYAEPLAAPDAPADEFTSQAIRNVAGMGKEQLEKELQMYKDPKKRADILKRMGMQAAGGANDLLNLLASGVDVVQERIPALRKPASVLDPSGKTLGYQPKFRLSSDEPTLGSEHLIRKAKEAGLLGETEAPITEIVGGILTGAAGPKLAKSGLKAIKEASKR